MWRESSSEANPDSSSEEGTSNSMKTKRLLSRNVLARALQIRSQKMNCAHRTLKEMHKPWSVNVRIGRYGVRHRVREGDIAGAPMKYGKCWTFYESTEGVQQADCFEEKESPRPKVKERFEPRKAAADKINLWQV
jgi:hypothetical protein